MEHEYIPTPLSKKEKQQADQIRNMWRKKCPVGLSPADIERMDDEDILDCWHIGNESIEDVFKNAAETRIFGIYENDDFS